MLFSVIIPTYNRPQHVAELIRSWAAVDFPADDFEVLLADDGGSVDLQPIVQTYAGSLPLRLLRLPHVSASSARASALAEARGRYVLCSDDDCRPDPGLLNAYRDAIRTFPSAAIGGSVYNLLEKDVFATATQEIISYVVEEWNKNPLDATFFTVSNLVFPADELRAIGGFDSTWLWRTGEDRDICRRWCERGHRMVYRREALMWHAHGLTLRKFWRQHYNYGEGNWASHARRTVPQAGAPDISRASFYAGLFLRPFRGLPFGMAVRVAAAIWLAQIANAVGFASAWMRSRQP